MYGCMDVWMYGLYVCMDVCMYVCMYVCIRFINCYTSSVNVCHRAPVAPVVMLRMGLETQQLDAKTVHHLDAQLLTHLTSAY